MLFGGDERKNTSNRAQPGVGFETAELAFGDRRAVSVLVRVEDDGCPI